MDERQGRSASDLKGRSKNLEFDNSMSPSTDLQRPHSPNDSECSDQPLLTSTSPLSSPPFTPEATQRSLAWSLGLCRSIASLTSRWTSQTNTFVRSSPESVASRFLDDFERTFGTEHVPFFQGGYAQALGKAKQELRLLLIVLQSDEHDDMYKFNSEILASSDLQTFIEQQNILVWGGNVRDAEAFQVSSILQATAYPFLAILSLHISPSSSRTSSVSPKMTVVDRIEGLTTTSEVIRRCESAITRCEPTLRRMRTEREQRGIREQERQQQEDAYNASLRADQEKARQARKERDAADREKAQKARQEREAIYQAQQQEMERQNQRLLRQQYIQYLHASMRSEPNTTDDERIVKISFRLPTGERVVRRFRGDDSIKTLYEFIEVYPLLKQQHEIPVDAKAPVNYHHNFSFTLHSPYPNKEQATYICDGDRLLRDEASLWPNALLIVDKLDTER